MTCKNIHSNFLYTEKAQDSRKQGLNEDPLPNYVQYLTLWLEPMAHAQREQQLFFVFSFPSPIKVISIVLWAAL